MQMVYMIFYVTIVTGLVVFSHGIRTNCPGQIPFDTVVIFGDSRSDTGNIYTDTKGQWPAPPYYNGRFSNGPVWVDYLKVLNKINYANAGATTDSSLAQGYVGPTNIPPPGVHQQIGMYMNDTNTTLIDFQCTLYIIWVGADNYFYNTALIQNPAAVAASLRDQVATLIVMGAKHILVLNEQPLELVPEVRIQNLSAVFHSLVIQENNFLSSYISALQNAYSSVSIRIFDAYSLVLNIVNGSSLNTDTPCWVIPNFTVTSQCSNPNSYLFIDSFHFPTQIHKIIANNVNQFISSGSTRFVAYSFIAQFVPIIIFQFVLCLIKLSSIDSQFISN